jgi:glutamate-1-semialdehyde 2,1-aminomutase
VTRIVEFNDVDALEKALAPKDIAIMITEPAMTNIGIIQPEPGYHEAMRELTRRYGTLLLIDETHTICAGPAGLTGILNLEPDMLTLGKPLGGGIPGAVGGVSREIGEMLNARPAWGNFSKTS